MGELEVLLFDFSTHSSLNILSRKVEGIGPLKPWQPRKEGAKSNPFLG